MDQKWLPTTIESQLAHVIEECGEVLAAAGKIQRFGWNNFNPDAPKDERESNFRVLLREMDDLEQAMRSLRQGMKERGA